MFPLYLYYMDSDAITQIFDHTPVCYPLRKGLMNIQSTYLLFDIHWKRPIKNVYSRFLRKFVRHILYVFPLSDTVLAILWFHISVLVLSYLSLRRREQNGVIIRLEGVPLQASCDSYTIMT